MVITDAMIRNASRRAAADRLAGAKPYFDSGYTLPQAAKAIGCYPQNLRRTIRRAAARAGVDPETGEPHPVGRAAANGDADAGFKIAKRTTLYRLDGEDDPRPVLEWVGTKPEHQQLAQGLQTVADALASGLPRDPEPPAPTETVADLLAQYTITDLHLGLLSWAPETGEDYNTRRAEQAMRNFIETAASEAPAAETAVLAMLGDMLHWDGLEPVTNRHGHVLDADTRFDRLIFAAGRLVRWAIDRLLRKHARVHVVWCEGNHDEATVKALRSMFNAFYEDNPRVTVDTTPGVYQHYQHGRTLLIYHHGHKSAPKQIATAAVNEFAPQIGQASHVYAHLGHRHHDYELDHGYMKAVQHRALCARSSHEARLGYNSPRDAKLFIYHTDHGERARFTYPIGMIDAAPEGEDD